MPIQMPAGPPNSVHSYPGAPGGVNQAKPPSDIDDTECVMLQDGFVNQPEYIRRRGPVRGAPGTPVLAYKGCGLALAMSPDGLHHLAGFSGDATHGRMEILDTSYSAVAADIPWGMVLPITPTYRIFKAAPALKAGTLIGISDTTGLVGASQYATGWIKMQHTPVGGGVAGTTITIDSVTYSLVTSINNAVANQILVATTDSDGTVHRRIVAAINDSGWNKGTAYSNATTAHPTVTASQPTYVDRVDVRAKTIGTGGNSIGLSTTSTNIDVSGATLTDGRDGATSNQALGYWMGGASPDSTGALTVSRGSTSVTGSGTSFTTDVTPGMWVIYANQLVGCVSSITDDTHLILVDPAFIALAGDTATFTAIRGVYPRVIVGSITTSTASTTVTGGSTKFSDISTPVHGTSFARETTSSWARSPR